MASQDSRKLVGFNVRNKDSVAQTYICHLCNLILRDPVQLFCGHRICRPCVNIDEANSEMKCQICNIKTPKDQIIFDRGCQQDMETLQILCSFCDWNGIFRNYPEHLSTNHTNTSCEYCGQGFNKMNLLHQHQSECEKILISCQLKPYGCTEQFLRSNKRNHLLTEKHQSIMLSILSPNTLHRMNTSTDPQMGSSTMDMDVSQTTASSSTTPNDGLTETIDVLLNGIEVLNDDTQKLSTNTVHAQYLLQSQAEDLSKLKLSIQESNAAIESLKTNRDILLQDLASIKQNVEDQKATSYDGTFLWRITDVRKKIADAQSEKQTSIYSPSFYSSPNGYKMRSRLYLYGDGNARRTHLSLFFVLMRGDHDAILQFPFTYKVTFCLYDQTPQQRHIIDSFRPDVKSTSFQRPRLEMNTASGIPKFFPIAMIQQDNNPYVQNDTMFIKIMVHFHETPKILLPYVLSLNPGLSYPIQQLMVKNEIERRAQQQQTTLTDVPTLVPTTDEKN